MKDTFDLSAMTNARLIYHANIQGLPIEMLKFKNALALEIVKDIFVESNENHYKEL